MKIKTNIMATEQLDILFVNPGGFRKRVYQELSKDYSAIDSKIPFARFINRMSFWMATGSGKTLIIVKLIELLGHLISEKEIPKNDILFLAHRDDLLQQFKNHIDEFNSFNFDTKINIKNLKDYENIKRENALPFAKNEITVFYYRSDLISDEQKEKIVNFKNYDNNGKWYVLLDEAHKGDREDSKRQVLYSILSRNGFLFNFSATFTDPRDYATCAFNFNLSKFIEEGYGKHIYVSSSEVTAFRDQDDFSKITKQKIVLKASGLNEGVYRLELSDFDGLVTNLKINSNKVVAEKVFLADNEIYGAEKDLSEPENSDKPLA